MKLKVIKKYITQYKDPIILSKGDIVKLGEEEKEEKWKGWIWATSANNSGWIPKNIIETKDGKSGVITENYSAKELNVDEGESVTQIKELYGWLLVRSLSSGEEGWIPKENTSSTQN